VSDAENSAELSASAEAWWDAIDASVLDVLAAAGGRLTVREIAAKVGMSEDAARSVVTMLAERGKVRIAAVEVRTRPLAVAPSRAGSAMTETSVDRRRATP